MPTYTGNLNFIEEFGDPNNITMTAIHPTKPLIAVINGTDGLTLYGIDAENKVTLLPTGVTGLGQVHSVGWLGENHLAITADGLIGLLTFRLNINNTVTAIGPPKYDGSDDYYHFHYNPVNSRIYVAAETDGVHVYDFDAVLETVTYVSTYFNPPYRALKIVGDENGNVYVTRSGAGIEALRDNGSGVLSNVVSEWSVSNPSNLDIKDNVLVVGSWLPNEGLKFYSINPATGFPTPVPGVIAPMAPPLTLNIATSKTTTIKTGG